jgi:hypothetical protein
MYGRDVRKEGRKDERTEGRDVRKRCKKEM